MTEPDWTQLEQLWRSTEKAAPAVDIIARQKRRHWAARSLLYTEIVIGIGGVGLSVWVMTLEQPFTLLIGGAALLFTLFTCAASVWARFPKRALPEESVLAELDAAIDRVRASVRWGLASFWVVVACLVYLAALVLLFTSIPGGTIEQARIVSYAVAFACVWAAAGQAFAIVYYLRRTRELARLEEIKRSLLNETGS